MADDSLLDRLVEEFIRESRQGKLPDIEEYAVKHPELAERVRELFPTLLLLEGMAATGDTGPGAPLDRSELSPGGTFGQYRIEREIGRGGMGIVYEATHVLLEKRVALKVLLVHPTMDVGHLERFFREARTAAGLHHTNIVPVFDVGQVGGTPYYAMQYIEGRSLDAILRIMQSAMKQEAPAVPQSDFTGDTTYEPQAGSEEEMSRVEKETRTERFFFDSSVRILAGLPEKTAEYFRWVAGIGIQAAEGLAHAHDRKVIHRDIKPSNLIIDEQGIVWIADFGLARRIEDPGVTQSGTLIGTPRYMSPEQAETARHPVDHRSDIYSLGATLYELLTCNPVFEGKTPHDVISQIITREPVEPRQLNAEIPVDLSTIVMKAMAKRPEDRYQSASQLADDLHRWLRMEPIKARRIGPVGKTVRWCRRNPRLAIILALSCVYYIGLMIEYDTTRTALKGEREARAAADMNGYVANLTAADLYLRSNSIAEAEQRLEACSTSLRGWEYEHLKLRLNAASATIQLNSIPKQLTLSSDGSKVLWLSEEENEIQAADIRSQRLVPFSKNIGKESTQVTGPPYLIAFSRDGELIARTLWKGQIRQMSSSGTRWKITAASQAGNREWNPLRNILEIGRDLHGAAVSSIKFTEAGVWEGDEYPAAVLPQHPWGMSRDSGSVISAVFSPDGARFAAWSWDGKIRVCHTESGKLLCLLSGDPDGVTAVVFSPLGDLVAAGNFDGSVHIWALPSGTPIAVLRGPQTPISSLMFLPDGKRIASGSYLDAFVRIWDPFSGTLDRALEIGSAALAFSADGRRIVGAEFSNIQVAETASGMRLFSLSGHEGAVTSVVFDAGGKRIISGAYDKTIRFWDVNSLSYVTNLAIPEGEVASTKWNPDAIHIAMDIFTYRSDSPLRTLETPISRSAVIWDTVSGETASIINWPAEKIKRARIPSDWRTGTNAEGAFSTDAGKVVAVFDDEIRLSDLKSGSRSLILSGQKGRIVRVALAPDGKTIASASERPASIALWDASSGKLLRTLTDHGDIISWLEYNHDGSRLISAGWDKTVRIWDVATGKSLTVLRGHEKAVSKASFSPDGSLVLSASSDNTVRVWKSATGEERFSFSCTNAEAIFNRDGSRIYASCRDGTLGVWDTKTGSLLDSSKTHKIPLISLSLSPDGSRLIAAGVDETIKIFDAASLTPLLTIPTDSRISTVAFSPDGSSILSVGGGKAKVWRSKRSD